MREERQPHVEQDVGGNFRVAQPAHDVQHKTGDSQPEERRDNPEQLRRITSDERLVHERPREQRQHERKPGTEQREHHDQRESAPVRPDVGERAPEIRSEQSGCRGWLQFPAPGDRAGISTSPVMSAPNSTVFWSRNVFASYTSMVLPATWT